MLELSWASKTCTSFAHISKRSDTRFSFTAKNRNDENKNKNRKKQKIKSAGTTRMASCFKLESYLVIATMSATSAIPFFRPYKAQ